MNKSSLMTLDLFLGKKLKDFRIRVGWSQSYLAEKVGVSHQQICKYEQGYSKISTHMLYLFSHVFETTPNTFFEGFKPTPSESSSTNTNLSARKDVIHVCLIEDNSADELFIRTFLENMNHKINVYCLRTNEEVYKFLKRRIITSPFPKPDMVLLDIKMQKVDGLGILKSLKQDHKTRSIPLIVLTNSLNKEDVINAYKNYANGYINKSFDSDVFQQNLKIAMDYWVEAVILPDESAKVA